MRNLKLVKNFLSMVLMQSVNYLAPIITLPYLVKVLGAETFGSLTYSLAMATIIMAITDWGFNLSATRKISQATGNQVKEIFWNTIAAKAALSLASLLLTIAIFFIFEKVHSLGVLVFISWLMVLGNTLNINWYFQGIEQFSTIARIGIATKLLTIPAVFFLVKEPSDVWKAALITVSSFLLQPAISAIIARFKYEMKWNRPTIHGIVTQIKDGASIFISSFSAILFNNANTLIIGATNEMSQVAIYSVAEKIKTASNMPAAQLTNISYPRISSAYAASREIPCQLIKTNLLVNAVITIATLTGLLFFSEEIIILIFSEEFRASAEVLITLFSAYIFGNTAYAFGLLVMINTGMIRERTYIMLAAGVISLPLAFILSGKYGAIGAAYAVLAAEAFILAGFIIVYTRKSKL